MGWGGVDNRCMGAGVYFGAARVNGPDSGSGPVRRRSQTPSLALVGLGMVGGEDPHRQSSEVQFSEVSPWEPSSASSAVAVLM